MKQEIFAKGLIFIREAFPSKEINAKVYYEALKDISDEDFENAVLEIIQKTKDLYPGSNLIAMIREKVTGSCEDLALIAWTQARAAILSHGYYRSISFEDRVINGVIEGMGGWEKFSSMLLEEEPFRQKDFINLYEAFYRSKRVCPERLVGNFERLNGFSEETILIPHASTNKKLISNL